MISLCLILKQWIGNSSNNQPSHNVDKILCELEKEMITMMWYWEKIHFL